mmetsp:Transcript_160376/g.514683  ORF Transcript_160376/g.514683 Transcript_160376/m.514683 type:complete len:285 (-) Transcript_160376:68-922(-)
MRAGRVAILGGLQKVATLLPRAQDGAHLVGRLDRYSLQALTTEGVAFARVLLDLELLLLLGLGQQIDELLPAAVSGVDLEEGGLHEEHLAACGPVSDVLEDARGGALHNALARGLALGRPEGARHRVGLARARHAVAEYCAVVALHDVVDDRRCLSEHVLLGALLAEVGIALEDVGLAPLLHARGHVGVGARREPVAVCSNDTQLQQQLVLRWFHLHPESRLPCRARVAALRSTPHGNTHGDAAAIGCGVALGVGGGDGSETGCAATPRRRPLHRHHDRPLRSR